MIEHKHTPSRHKSRLVTFLHLLISPKKVFTYYADGADICGVCGAYITLPYLYYSPITSVIYVFFGIVLSVGLGMLPRIFGLTLISFMLLHHVYCAAVFAFAPWDDYESEVRDAESYSREAQRSFARKFFCMIIGLIGAQIVANIVTSL